MSESASKKELLQKLLNKRRERSGVALVAVNGMTPFQESIFLASLSDPDHKEYLIHLIAEVKKPLSIQAATEAWISLFASSPSLGIYIVENIEGFELKENNLDVQKINVIPFVSINNFKNESLHETLSVLNAELYRIYLYTEEGNVKYMRMVFHHFLLDGTGIHILHQRLNDVLEGRIITVDQRYKDFRIECFENNNLYRNQASILAQTFKTADFSEISILAPSNEESILFKRKLDQKEITNFCSRHQITKPAFLYSILAFVISSLSRNSKVNLGTVLENRGIKDQDSLSCHINTNVLIYDFSALATLEDLVNSGRSVMMNMLNDCHIPFIFLREEFK